MFLIERVSTKLGHSISNYLNIKKEEEEVIIYGAIILLQMLYSILLVVLLGLMFNVVAEAIVISFTGCILRKYSGGVHSSSPNICAVIGAVISVVFSKGVSLIVKTVPLHIQVLLIVASLLYSYLYIYKYAPVESSKKPITDLLKRNRLKRYSLILVTILYLIICILLFIYKCYTNLYFIIYADCICIGIVWQTFSLTNIGRKLLHNIDLLFIKQRKDE